MARFSFAALSKSKRRLLLTLPAVGVVTALGGAGIWQAHAGKSKLAEIAKALDEQNSEVQSRLKKGASAKAAKGAAASAPALNGQDEELRPPLRTSPFAAPGRANSPARMPSPQETVVRGNDASRFESDVSPASGVDRAPSFSGNPFSKKNAQDAGAAADAPAARRGVGGAFQPRAMALDDAEEEQAAEESGEESEADDESYADEETEAAVDDGAQSDSEFVDDRPPLRSSRQRAREIDDEQLAEAAEEEATEAPEEYAGGRAALGAPVELSVADEADLDARPLRRAAEAVSVADDAAPADQALAVPGPRHLEGAQTPTLTIEKIAPPEMQVNRPATLKVIVRNVGQVAAQDVMVFDQAPRGAVLEETTPPASQGPDGAIVWQLGDLAPGEQAEVTMRIVPKAEGELGSVAKVAFQAQATARSLCTRPQLVVKQTTPPRVLIGQKVLVSITISNPGTGAAENVVLEETLPDGLTHAAGRELEYEVGMLRPGETRSLELELVADKAGRLENRLVVRGAGDLSAEDQAEIEVIAPQLDVAVKGPAKRYLERLATYNIALLNAGTAPARNVELVSYLPKGLKFVSANNQGRYDAPNHAVYWSLEELPAGAKGDVQVTAEPVEVGEQKLRVEGRADLGLAKVLEQVVLVEGLAELFYTVTDSADPIEVGADTIYQIRVINQGSKVDTNVQVAVDLPDELQPMAGEGPVRYEIQGQQVVFEPLARLGPQEEATFKVQVRGAAAGDHKAKVILTSDETRTEVSKEEGTRVYAD
jgi:uncharacterized repeat protein (TIGR01451 family)